MKKLTPLGTKTAILVTEDRLEILPPLRTYEVYYEDHHKLMSFVCEGLTHLNLSWVGCELEPDYVAIANKRLEKVQGSLF